MITPPRKAIGDEHRQPQTRTPHLWRNDITGLRALAVLPVLLFHAFPELLPGGFFGVDVFFVISGYLIAGIIFRGLIANNFSYLDFYAKRIRRIIPNLLLVLLFVVIAGAIFMTAEEYYRLGRHIQSSTFFTENFRLLKEADYFDISSQFKPLLHLWSLAIEEQFYIFFPVIAASIWACNKKWSAHQKTGVISLGIFIVLLTLGSFVACLSQRDLTKAFYFPQCRFWELGVGIILAWGETFKVFDFTKTAQWLRNTLSLMGFVLIVGVIVLYSKDFRAPGWISLIPTLGAAFIMAAGANAAVNRTLLSWRFMTFIGLISYSVYLWHWPLLSFMHLVHPQATEWMAGLGLLISFVIATAVYYWIELPVRRTTKVNAKRLVVLLLVGMLVSWGTGWLLKSTKGMPNRPYAQLTKEQKAFENEWTHFAKMKGYNEIKAKNGAIGHVIIGNTSPNILFIGDSHTAHYSALIEKLSDETGVSAEILATGGCMVALPGKSADPEKNVCNKLQKEFINKIRNSNIKTIVISQRWDLYYENKEYYCKSFGDDAKGFRNGGFELALRDIIENVRRDQNIYILLDNPGGKKYDPRFAAFDRFESLKERKLTSGKIAIGIDEPWKVSNDIVMKVIEDARDDRITLIDVTQQLFPSQQVDISKIYYNEDHLRTDWVRDNVHFFDEIFNIKKR